jgi:hypothetical protein
MPKTASQDYLKGYADAQLDTIIRLHAALKELRKTIQATNDVLYIDACEIAKGIILELIADLVTG